MLRYRCFCRKKQPFNFADPFSTAFNYSYISNNPKISYFGEWLELNFLLVINLNQED